MNMKSNPTTVWMDVTPQQAAEWLEANRGNRRLSKAKIAKYANEMTDGTWSLTHQGIAFAPDGRLLDGQHRLMAIVSVGATIRMQVNFGLSPETFKKIDVGWGRTAHQMADMMGTPGARNATSAVRQLIRWDRDRWFSDNATIHEPNHLVADLTDIETPLGAEIQVSMKAVRAGLGHNKPIIGQFAFSIAFHLVAARVDRDYADDFFYRLNTGVGLGARSPVLLLRDRILRGSHCPTDQHERALVLKAWNYFRADRDMRTLRWREVEEWPNPGYNDDVVAPCLVEA